MGNGDNFLLLCKLFCYSYGIFICRKKRCKIHIYIETFAGSILLVCWMLEEIRMLLFRYLKVDTGIEHIGKKMDLILGEKIGNGGS